MSFELGWKLLPSVLCMIPVEYWGWPDDFWEKNSQSEKLRFFAISWDFCGPTPYRFECPKWPFFMQGFPFDVTPEIKQSLRWTPKGSSPTQLFSPRLRKLTKIHLERKHDSQKNAKNRNFPMGLTKVKDCFGKKAHICQNSWLLLRRYKSLWKWVCRDLVPSLCCTRRTTRGVNPGFRANPHIFELKSRESPELASGMVFHANLKPVFPAAPIADVRILLGT